jgi:hypothetical protein
VKTARHHFVPRFYLGRFSIDGKGKAIGVFNVHSKIYVPSGKLKTQAYRPDFYGKTAEVEQALAALEGRAASILRMIDASGRMPVRYSEPHESFLMYVYFQARRTEAAAIEHNEMIDKVWKRVFGKDPRVSEYLPHFQIGHEDPAQRALGLAAATYGMGIDLEYRLILNRSDQPFISSDNPVVLYNQYLERKDNRIGSITGLALTGFQMFFPISPCAAVLFYDGDVYSVGGRDCASVEVTRASDIVSMNGLQCMNAQENLYFPDGVGESQLRKLVSAARKYRLNAKADVLEIPGEKSGDMEHSLIMLHRLDVRCRLSLGFIRVRTKARKARLGSSVPVRNKELCELHKRYIFSLENKQFAGLFTDYLRVEGGLGAGQ